MRLLVGLGNPGAEYEGTRHNIGFVAVDAVAAALNVQSWKSFKDGLLAKAAVGAEPVLLFKPQQYMNNSGVQVRQVADYYSLAVEDIAVAYDDVYVQPGSVRIRQAGGDGGHNGIKSLHTHLPSDSFWRIRIGAGLFDQSVENRHHQPRLEDYVLQKFPPHDKKLAHKAIDNMLPDLLKWLEHGTGLTTQTLHI